MDYSSTPAPKNPHPSEETRLEAVTTCVGFDDILDATLSLNHPQLDNMIVVTSHADTATQQCAKKHGAICVLTDLFKKNGRDFNKGAAINAGMSRFQYHGWRLCLDADIILPDNYRRILFNHTTLDKNCLYGADRVDVIGTKELEDLKSTRIHSPQVSYNYKVSSQVNKPISGRYLDNLNGFQVLGYHQLYFADSQHSYPYSLGTASHDDICFSMQWGSEHRRLLPTVVVYHLSTAPTVIGQNWNGRTTPKLS